MNILSRLWIISENYETQILIGESLILELNLFPDSERRYLQKLCLSLFMFLT